jgi:GNAT superfamily N-acetyltransferase
LLPRPSLHYLPLEYPSDLERDVVSGDLRYLIRPIIPDDADRLKGFYARLAPETRCLQFFTDQPALSLEGLDHFTNVDYSRRLALVAVLDEEIIGVGRFDRRPGTDEAEVAFATTDGFIRYGVAALLLDQLVAAARCRGISGFVAHTVWKNQDMLCVLLESGFDVTRHVDCGVVTLHVSLHCTTTSLWALGMRHAAEQITPHAGGAIGPG